MDAPRSPARRLEARWYAPRPPPPWLLPAAALFGAVVRLRHRAYGCGLLRREHLPVPVVVVGNITAGGTGKTPLVLWLARWLRARGLRPGIVSRGYGGRGGLAEVHPHSDPAACGDEPLLLRRRSGCPVMVGRDRAAAGRALLRAHPDTDVLLCDDGLQHLRLARVMEIAVVDAARGLGNGALLPAGPLREPAQRLATVDAVVINGDGSTAALPGAVPRFAMTLHGDTCVNLRDPQRRCPAADLALPGLQAVAGIGHPARFFAHLAALGLQAVPHPFPDHHAYSAPDLAFAAQAPLIMTEKDALKCSAFAQPGWWYLPVEARLDEDLGELLLARIGRR